MSDLITCNIKGLDELQKRLTEEEPKRARRILWQAAKKAGTVFKEAIISMVPVDTGTLRDSIRMSWRSLRGNQPGGALFVGPDRRTEPKTGIKASHVASWLEFGTHKMPPRPFMTQSFHMAVSRALGVFTEEMNRILNVSDRGQEELPATWDEPGGQTGSDAKGGSSQR